jgi:hypothetical protein
MFTKKSAVAALMAVSAIGFLVSPVKAQTQVNQGAEQNAVGEFNVAVENTGGSVAKMDAGSAGIPGYDDAKCQSLLADLNKALDITMEEYDAGTPNSSRARQAGALAPQIEKQLTDNCLVVY